jgi:diadenosine tetraphosphate (Ap4A) HIT family hydrolase
MSSIVAIAIVSPQGKILVSRQFREISRIRLEGLLSAFPKLITGGNGTGQSKDYTVIESGSFRYVYQPAESLHLVVLSNNTGNIVEELAVLRMAGRVLPERCAGPIDESSVVRSAFEILFAFDELVTNGQRENISLEQLNAVLEMFSAEEEMKQQEQQRRMEEAREVARAKAKELKSQRHAMAFDGGHSGGVGAMGGAPHLAMMAGSAPQGPITGGYQDAAVDLTVPAARPTAAMGGGGLSLSKVRKQDAATKAMREAGYTAAEAAAATAPSAPGSAPAAPALAAPSPATASSSGVSAPVMLRVDEKISATFSRDGFLQGVDVRGDLFIQVTDPAAAMVRVVLAPMAADFAAKTHPNVNKALFTSDNVIAIKDSKPYPVGSTLGVLKYRAQALSAGTPLPLTISCWPAEDSASIEVELENKNLVLRNVRLEFPIAAGVRATVDEATEGSTYTQDAATGRLIWVIPEISRNVNASCTLSVQLSAAAGDASFFPARVFFESPTPLSGARIVAVQNVQTGAPVAHHVDAVLSADEYVIN